MVRHWSTDHSKQTAETLAAAAKALGMTELVEIAFEPGARAALTSLGEMPSLDVIIPTRNRAHFLEECLASVRTQTHQPSTVWVVDDGSTDNTAALLGRQAQDWPQLRFVTSRGRGVSAARNTALDQSTADLVAFLDSDDLWAPDTLERLAALFGPGGLNPGFVHCGFRYADAEGNLQPSTSGATPRWRGWIFRKMLEEFYPVAQTAMMVRRDLALDVGGFDEQLTQAEDRDFCLKIARHWAVDAVPDAGVRVRQHGDNAYMGTMRRDPGYVLFQRLAVWNRWLHQMSDREAVLRRFRLEATKTARFNIKHLRFGLYGQLRSSSLELARMLFRTRLDYLRAVLVPGPGELKAWIGTHAIMRSQLLLKVAQRLGRFRGVGVDTRGGR